MSRWIDADAIKIPKTHVDMFENCRNCELLDEEQVRELINSAPSIDIVKCEECIFSDRDEPLTDGRRWCVILQGFMHYCSEGKRSK